MTYVDPDRENNTFLGQHYRYMGPEELHYTMDLFDRIYERRKDLKREAVHYRVTFEKKPFSPIGEVGWEPAGDCDGIASNVYLHDALYGLYKTGYQFDPHDEVYTVRKGPKKWTRNYVSALLKGLGYELV